MHPSTGAIHAVGTYDHSSLLNLVPGPFGLVSTNGGTDAFLVKLNAGNNVSWARRIGGSSNDAGNGVCIGPNGNIYVTGSFKGSMSETLISAVLSTLTSTNGSQDIFVACYTPTGELLWMEKAGGTDNETGFSIAANSSGVFVHGQFRGPAQFGSITVSPPATGKDHLFVAKYPLTGGDPEWVRQGVNSKDNTAGKITADEDGAYVTGTFKENFLSWRTPANGVLSTVNCANNNQNIHITSFSNSGDINWMKAINESGSESASNAIAVTCGRVIISGRVHTGSSIPGLGILSHAGAHDVLFIASFDKSTGNGQWVRTALGDSDHLNEGLDLCVGTSGQILLSGTFEEWLTWDNGQNFTGDGGQEMFIASFSPWGDLIWWRAETADSHEWPYAIATDDQGKIIVGGRYEQSISLPPFSASSNSNDNIFLASRIGTLTWANDPSKWDHPGTLCSNTGQIDLNTRLRGTGRKVLSSTSMTDPALSLGLPDGAGSAFNAAGSSITIDLGDTLESGSAYRITWRLASSGLGKMAIEYSSDGSNWTSHSSIQQNSSLTYSDAELTSPVAFRYIRLTRPTSVTSANFLMDGITTRINTLYGGAWSGEQITSSGILDLSGLNGTYAYTYTITSDACTWSTTRQLHIMVPGSSGIITGSSSICPGTSPGPLTLTGNTGQIIRWERSIDGFVSILPINSTAVSITPGNLTVTTQWRVLLDQGACGMVHSAVHTVTVADTIAPAIICPADITVAVGAGCTATVQFAVPTAIDNCGGTVSMTRIAGPANNSAFPIGSTVITYKAVDASENTATCSFTVNVIDESPPVIMSAPAGPLVLDLGDDCEVMMPDLRNQLNVSDCSPMSLVQTPAPGTFITSSDDLTITVSAAGGTTSWSTPIDVIDATPPTMTCPGGLTIQLPPGDSTMAVNYAEPGVADNCGPVTLLHVGPFPVSGGQFHAGSTILEFQAEDAAGNTATCSFEIVLVPNDVPQISCPANIQVTTALGLCEQLVAYPVPVASDNQDGTLTPALVQGDPPGNFSVGDHPISYTVTDLDGNSASCTFIVEVMDEEAPVLACPDTTTISSSAGCTALVPDLTSTLIAGDNCGGAISIVQIPAAGSVRSIGSHSITFHVSDASGNTAQCTSILTIIDDTAPVIICPPDTVLNADANSCGTTHDATVVATDACIFVTVWNDHPDQWFEVGTTTVTAFASDAADNTVNCSFQVTVVDVTIPDLECPEDLTQIPTDPGECTSLVQFSAITDDACGGVDLTFSHHTNDLPVHAFPVGLTTVSVDAIDAHGLSNSCQFTVEVIDLQVPEIQCPASIVNTVMPGECGANITFDATANDNCGIASINYSHPPGGYFTIGDHVIDCIATDLSGNVTTCSFNISIMDLDSDGDGTGDCTDQCPDDPLKTLAGDCGCDQPEPGTSCDDNDADTVNDTIGTDCACTGEPVDCAGIANGSAYFDNCGSCVGGTTNIDPCTQDCAGTWGGSAIPGSACDDGNPCTINDTFGPDCFCAGTPSAPNALFYYTTEEFCTNGTDPTPYVATPGGIFIAVSIGIVVDPINGTIDLSETTPGIHTIKYFFDGICPNLYLNTITVTEPPASEWMAIGPLCSGSAPVDLNTLLSPETPTGGIWTGTGVSNGYFDPSSSGIFPIRYQVSSGGCSSATIATIEVLPAPVANAGPDAVLCGNEHVLQATPGNGSWSVPQGILSNDLNTHDATIVAEAYGTYELVWTISESGCSASDNVVITFQDPGTDLFVTAGEDRTISIVKSAVLSGDASPTAQVQWRVLQGSGAFSAPTDLHTSIVGLASGTNVIELSARIGSCASAADTLIVTVLDLFIPEGFSPNADGVNDHFEITGIDAFPAASLSVFDRWGRQVFSSNAYSNEWNGHSMNGKELVNDTYFYVLDLGDQGNYNGSIIIKR